MDSRKRSVEAGFDLWNVPLLFSPLMNSFNNDSSRCRITGYLRELYTSSQS